MAKMKEPIAIKKYANRRLYNTGTSAYVTLEDLAAMVKAGEDFVVYDAKSNEDITRSVLTQIIFEQESKGQNLLPLTFLRQMIRFYGDSIQALVPSFLDFSIANFAREQKKLTEQMTRGWTADSWPGASGLSSLEEQARSNMALFEQAFRMFSPFGISGNEGPDEAAAKPAKGVGELDELKRQLAEVRRRLDRLAGGKS